MRIRIAILGIAAFAFSHVTALAEKRVALIIGNSAYQNVTALPNPTNDAAAMTATLKGAGFDVIDTRRDLKANEMRRALRDFSDTARDADVAVVYYAGHGIEIDGTNYLVPVDASLEAHPTPLPSMGKFGRFPPNMGCTPCGVVTTTCVPCSSASPPFS